MGVLKKYRKELDALVNIPVQKGSYVKATIFKLHGRFLFIQLYLLSM